MLCDCACAWAGSGMPYAVISSWSERRSRTGMGTLLIKYKEITEMRHWSNKQHKAPSSREQSPWAFRKAGKHDRGHRGRMWKPVCSGERQEPNFQRTHTVRPRSPVSLERISGILSKTFDRNQASTHKLWQSRERENRTPVTPPYRHQMGIFWRNMVPLADSQMNSSSEGRTKSSPAWGEIVLHMAFFLFVVQKPWHDLGKIPFPERYPHCTPIFLNTQKSMNLQEKRAF